VWSLQLSLGRTREEPAVSGKILRMSEHGNDGEHPSFGQSLDRLIEEREADQEKAEKRAGDALSDCFGVLRDRVDPLFERTAERINHSSLKVRAKAGYVNLEGASWLKLLDHTGEEIAPQLIGACHLDQRLIRIDLGEADEYRYTFDIEPCELVTLFRSKVGRDSHNYPAVTDELLERAIMVYLDLFL
jgi:hypothetical protein